MKGAMAVGYHGRGKPGPYGYFGEINFIGMLPAKGVWTVNNNRTFRKRGVDSLMTFGEHDGPRRPIMLARGCFLDHGSPKGASTLPSSVVRMPGRVPYALARATPRKFISPYCP